jgi:hypothetical protein
VANILNHEVRAEDNLAEAAVGNCQAATRAGRPALALALCGDAVGAGKLAAAKTKQQPNGTLWNAVQLPAIHVATELRRDRPAAAIEILAAATPYERASRRWSICARWRTCG